jgi:hypothetical protein
MPSGDSDSTRTASSAHESPPSRLIYASRVPPPLGANRFDLEYGMGAPSHDALMTTIELYGTQVIPRVRELLQQDEPLAAAS